MTLDRTFDDDVTGVGGADDELGVLAAASRALRSGVPDDFPLPLLGSALSAAHAAAAPLGPIAPDAIRVRSD